METRNRLEPVLLLAIAVFCLVVSGVRPYGRMTWVMEVFPVVIGAVILVATYRRFPLTLILYRLLLVHALILILGGYYSYARVPLGFWVQDIFDLSRNHYDRLGHLAQGFVPAILARELLIRKSPLEKGKWLFFIVTSICLAFSAFYELFEWWYAIIAGGESATDFLGSQGDVWDAQWDMFIALIGAISAQLILARPHNSALARLRENGE